jgi:hypothetical protein
MSSLHLSVTSWFIALFRSSVGCASSTFRFYTYVQINFSLTSKSASQSLQLMYMLSLTKTFSTCLCHICSDRSQHTEAYYQTKSAMQKHTFTSLYSDSRTDFDNLKLREETFIFYPPSEVPTLTLADAGFYFTGNEDISQCFACKLQINRLKQREDPMSVHRLRSPTCPFVLQSPQRESTNDAELSLELPTFVEKLTPKVTVGEFACLFRAYFWHWFDNAPLSSFNRDVRYFVDTEALRRENDMLRASITCRVCEKYNIQTVFLPCRHLVACEECSEKLESCVKCRAEILATIRIYFGWIIC